MRTVALPWIRMAAIGLCWSGLARSAEPPAEDPWTTGRLFERSPSFTIPPRTVELGRDELQRTWDFSRADRGNITFLDKVSNVRVSTDGALAFTLTDRPGVLGWGNYAGAQPESERVRLWTRTFFVKLDARQTAAGPTTVAFRFWHNGARVRLGRGAKPWSARLEGTNAQELVFSLQSELPRKDGFDLEFSGPAGNVIELRNLRIERTEYEGWFRKEFVLPDSPVWQARIEVGNQARLFVNGLEVRGESIMGNSRPNVGGAEMYHSEPIEIAEHLVPGRTNCIGLYGWREQYQPNISLQGSVIPVSGERIPLCSDTSWSWTPAEPPEPWNRPGFDASGWSRVEERVTTNAGLQRLYGVEYRSATDRPVHDGPLALENPKDPQFFYTDADDLVFHARAPAGLAARQPALEWILSRYENGVLSERNRSTVSSYDLDGHSLRYAVNAGRVPRGVYTLETRLTAGDLVLDRRIPEPLVVAGRIPMRPADGLDLRQDMDLVLERAIDMTRPESEPWLESDGADMRTQCTTNTEGGVAVPAVVTRGGLAYRETRPARGSIISYLVRFEHPGDFYLMELDYPNDMARHMGVACCPHMWGDGLMNESCYSKTSASVATGGRYPLTERLQTLSWVYRPDAGNHALYLMNLWNQAPAAGAALRIYHVRNGLPALRAPDRHTRWSGYVTENVRSALFSSLKAPRPTATELRVRLNWKHLNPVLATCRWLADTLDACEYFTRYMKFAGQNVYLMGVFQYGGQQAEPIQMEWPFPSARVRLCVPGVLARVMRENGIDFYASVEFIYNTLVMERVAQQPARPLTGFWDTPYLVNGQGREYSEWEGRYGLNFNHSIVRREMIRVADELARKFQALPNFKGVSWTPFFESDWLPGYRARSQTDRLEYSYDDVTLRQFEQESGVQAPFSLDDPLRFQKRYAWLTSPAMRPKWVAWRAAAMTGFFSDALAALRARRADLEMLCNLYPTPRTDREWRESGLGFAEYMRENGWDSRLFQEQPGLWLADLMHGKLNVRGTGNQPGLDMSGSAERFAFFAGERNRAAHVKHDWLEMERCAWALPYRPDWPRFFQPTFLLQPDGYNTLEVFTRGLIGLDAELFCYGFADTVLFMGNEQPLREFHRVLRALPREKFQPAADTGLDTNLALRELRKDGAYYFYAANPGYWPVRGSVTLERAAEVRDLVTGAPAARPDREGRTRVPVVLKPFAIAAWSAPSDTARIAAWEAAPDKGLETAHLEKLVARAEELLTIPAAQASLGADDEAFMREAVRSAHTGLEAGNYAGALQAVSSDRFVILTEDFLEKGARYGTETERSADVSRERRAARARLAAPAPVVDGILDDPAWGAAEPYTGFITTDGLPAMAATRFRVAYDADALYVAVECRDRHPEEIKGRAVREREGSVFADDVVMLFLQPDPAADIYYQMAVSAGGVVFDQKVLGGDLDYTFAPPWSAKTRVTDDGWVAEIKLPAASLEGALEPGKPWGFNVHRAVRGGVLPLSAWSYSPLGGHDPQRFGTLHLGGPAAAAEPNPN